MRPVGAAPGARRLEHAPPPGAQADVDARFDEVGSPLERATARRRRRRERCARRREGRVAPPRRHPAQLEQAERRAEASAVAARRPGRSVRLRTLPRRVLGRPRRHARARPLPAPPSRARSPRSVGCLVSSNGPIASYGSAQGRGPIDRAEVELGERMERPREERSAPRPAAGCRLPGSSARPDRLVLLDPEERPAQTEGLSRAGRPSRRTTPPTSRGSLPVCPSSSPVIDLAERDGGPLDQPPAEAYGSPSARRAPSARRLVRPARRKRAGSRRAESRSAAYVGRVGSILLRFGRGARGVPARLARWQS